MVLLVPIEDPSSPVLPLRDTLAALDAAARWISPFAWLERVVDGAMSGAWQSALLEPRGLARVRRPHDRPRGLLAAPARRLAEGRVRALRLLLLVLAGMCGAAPCFAQADEQLVWWPLVTDGQEYRRVPYPQEAGSLLVLAGSDVVIEARFAPVSYWPITREYLADLSQQPRAAEGSIEIVDGSGEVMLVEPEPYLLWHPLGVGAGPAQLAARRGGRCHSTQSYLEDARAAAAKEREYQRIVGLHQAAVEAWLRMAAERRGQNMPAPPPELEIVRPEPFHAFASEPRDAAVLALPAGRLHPADPRRRRRDRARQRARAGELCSARSRGRLRAAARGPLDPAGAQFRAGRDHLHDRPHRPLLRARSGRRVRCWALYAAVPSAVGRGRRCRADFVDGGHGARGCG